MTREELKALGIEGKTLEQVMALHGKDIERYKGFESQSTALQEQLKVQEDKITELEEKAKGNADLEKQIQELKDSSEKAKSDYETKIKTIKIDSAIDTFLTEKKAKNKVAVKSLLDLEKIVLDEKGEVSGLNEQWENVYKGNEYMFESENASPTVGNQLNNPNVNRFEEFRKL